MSRPSRLNTMHVAAWDSLLSPLYISLKFFPSISTAALGEKNPLLENKKKCSMYSLDTISRQMRSFHSIEHHQKTTPFVWLPPNSWRTLCLTEIDRRNTHNISTAKIDKAAQKTSGFQKELRKYGPMGYKSFLTQYVAVGHSISRTSFTYLLFPLPQVGIPGEFLALSAILHNSLFAEDV